MLDAAGGTDIFQMAIGRLEILSGLDAVRCVKLSARVYRWYAGCCRTPIGNTAGPGFPLFALIHSFAEAAPDAPPLGRVLGPPRCRLFARSATVELPPDAPPPVSAGLFLYRLRRVAGWWARGLGRPNPFFDDKTAAPISPPHVLGAEERAALESGIRRGGP